MLTLDRAILDAALDPARQHDYDRITRVATRALRAPVAQFNVITEDEQVSVSSVGPTEWLGRRAAGLDASYCQFVVRSGSALIVDDAQTHPLVATNRATRDAGIGAYLGTPIVLRDGSLAGTLCVVDFAPRRWSVDEQSLLEDLAASVAARIELTRETATLTRANAQLDRVLSAGAAFMYTLALADEQVGVLWASASIEQIAGYSVAEASAPTWWSDGVHPDDRAAATRAAEAVFEKEALVHEYRFRHRAGHYIWVRDERRLCRDAQGNPREVVGSWVDISKRKAEGAALQAAHDELEIRVQERTLALSEANAELRRSQVEMLTRLAQAAEYRDDDTGRHTRRVGHLAARLAETLDLSPHAVALLRCAAPLHDLGKIAIPDEILQKPGALTQEEFTVMTSHTRIGARILSGGRSALLVMAERIARSHHERWDGTGYPDRLSGEQIPMEARIVAVVDFYDALMSDRPYRAAWPRPRVLAEIRKGIGGHFDPRVARAFLALAAELTVQEADLAADADEAVA